MLDPSEYEAVSKSWLVNLGSIGQLGAESADVKVGKVAFSTNGSWFVATHTNNKLAFVWECNQPNEQLRIIQLCHTERVRDLKISDCGMILVGRDDGYVDALSISDDDDDVAHLVFRDQVHDGAILAVEFDPNNEMVYYSGGIDGIVRQHIGYSATANSSSCSNHYPILQMKGQHIRHIVVNPSYPNFIAISTSQAEVKLFHRCQHPNSDSGSHCNSTSLLDNYLLVESFCPQHLFNLSSDATVPMPHYSYPTCIKFHPNGKSILINYFLDHTYEFDIHSVTTVSDITTSRAGIDDCVMADTPWWVQFSFCNSVFEQVDLVKEVLYESNCAKELNMVSRCSTLLSIAVEMLTVISHLAKEQSMSSIFMEEISSIRSHSLYLQASLFMNRNFRGDAYAALKITGDILQCNPFDVSAKILQCKIHIELCNVNELIPLVQELEVLLSLHSELPTLISVKEDIHQLKTEARLLSEKPHTASEGKDHDKSYVANSSWRTRYEGLANLDEQQEVSYLGTGGKFIIGCNGNKLIIWDRWTSEIVHLHDLQHVNSPKIQTHPSAMICALSDPQGHICTFWGQLDLKNRMEASIRQLGSGARVTSSAFGVMDERCFPQKIDKIIDVAMPSTSNEEEDQDITDNNIEIVINVDIGSASNEFRIDNSTSLGEEEANKINAAGGTSANVLSSNEEPFNSVVVQSNDNSTHSLLVADEEVYFADEVDDPNHEYEENWISDGSIATSLSSDEASSGYNTSDDNSTTASIILDVYYDAVNASIAGYPLELKDLLSIEEMLKHNESNVEACKCHHCTVCLFKICRPFGDFSFLGILKRRRKTLRLDFYHYNLILSPCCLL